MFARLNIFLERCKDILEFVVLVQDFGKLDKIFISGTKGNSLTESIRELFSEFQEEVDKFKALPFDVMDITKQDFDDGQSTDVCVHFILSVVIIYK